MTAQSKKNRFETLVIFEVIQSHKTTFQLLLLLVIFAIISIF